MTKGLIVYVYRSKDSDCTNGGISSHYNKFILTGEGINGPFEPSKNTPEIKLVRRNIGGQIYMHAEPINKPLEGNYGWMHGGNYISSSDSRFPNEYPIAIHDRQETSEVHAMLSR